ncbi:MAG: hypothetical protein ACI9UK_001907 [Candidatus Krumholzibacteriia bacterium]|jgi:hypothetical protein
MKTTLSIQSQYRSATEDGRLALFVSRRDLRSEFSKIDLEGDGAWNDVEPISIELPRLAGIWVALKNAFRGRATKHSAPIRH